MNHLKALAERLRARAQLSSREVHGEQGIREYNSVGVALVELADDIEAVLEEAVPVEPDEPPPDLVSTALRAMAFLEDTTTLNDRAITRFRDFPETGRMVVQLKDGLKHYLGNGADLDEALRDAFGTYDAS